MSLPLKVGDLAARSGAVFEITDVEGDGTDDFDFAAGKCIVSAPPLDPQKPEPGWIQAGEEDDMLRGDMRKCHKDETAQEYHPLGYRCEE